jgi:hypothetical protein
MPTDEFYEHNRTISKVYATERGIFHSTGDEEVDLPDDLQGASLIELDVVHAVQMVNGGGEIFVLHFNVPKAQNQVENETPYINKETVNVDGADNQMQTGKVDENQIALGSSMKSLLEITDNK